MLGGSAVQAEQYLERLDPAHPAAAAAPQEAKPANVVVRGHGGVPDPRRPVIHSRHHGQACRGERQPIWLNQIGFCNNCGSSYDERTKTYLYVEGTKHLFPRRTRLLYGGLEML